MGVSVSYGVIVYHRAEGAGAASADALDRLGADRALNGEDEFVAAEPADEEQTTVLADG